MTRRDATPEELALARKIAINLWPGDDTEYLFERDAARNAALSAIQQTTELAVELAEVFTGHSSEALIAEALRRGDHLKQEAV